MGYSCEQPNNIDNLQIFPEFNRSQLLLLIFEIIHFDVRGNLNNFPLDSDSDTQVLFITCKKEKRKEKNGHANRIMIKNGEYYIN